MEEDDQRGLAHFLEHMAFKGTKTRSALQIAEEIENVGGYINAYTSREHTVYFAKVLKENTYKALDIISDIIQNSLYSKTDIEKDYQVICQEIAQSKDSPDDVAFDNIYQASFGDTPFGYSCFLTCIGMQYQKGFE